MPTNDKDNFFITIKLNADDAQKGLNKIDKGVKEIQEGMNQTQKAVDKIRDAADEQLDVLDKIQEIKRKITEYDALQTQAGKNKVKALKEELLQNRRILDASKGKYASDFSIKLRDKWESMSPGLQNIYDKGQRISDITNAIKSGTEFISDIISSINEKLSDIVDSSLLTNSTTRQNAFTYGMSAAQSYGFETAKQLLGNLSDEDLMYMNSEQSILFREKMTYFADKYAQLVDKGFFDKYLEFTVEWQSFKKELELDLLQFVVDNKDSIMTAMKMIVNIGKFLVDSLGKILTALGQEYEYSAEWEAGLSDTVSKYSTTSNNTITYNDNGTYNSNDATYLQNAGSVAYRQIIAAMGGSV